MDAPLSAALEALEEQARKHAGEFSLRADASGVEVASIAPALRFHHSFICGAVARRATQTSQLLLKACNNKQRSIHRILDVTAGWGIDSFVLASHGREVTLLEQNEMLFAVVACSLKILAADAKEVADRMRIVNVDANRFLQTLDDANGYDCIYLDPMFDAHKSGAKPAKEMQLLQAITSNVDIEACFESALSKAGKRVVVKRSAKAEALCGLKPDLSYRSKTVRFDIYLTA